MTPGSLAALKKTGPPLDLDALRAGDPKAFRELYERYQSAVLGLAFSIVGDWCRAEDVCQEVFLKVYEHLDRFEAGTNFKAWILTIAHHSAIDSRRRVRPEPSVDEGVPAPAPDLDARRAFEELLAPLDPEERLIVTLRYMQEMPYREIAPITRKAEGTLRNLVCAALGKLRDRWSRGGGTP